LSEIIALLGKGEGPNKTFTLNLGIALGLVVRSQNDGEFTGDLNLKTTGAYLALLVSPNAKSPENLHLGEGRGAVRHFKRAGGVKDENHDPRECGVELL